ncbi:MAG: N-acetylmuramoyl-L-alanine amidase [Pigmentiphaga sp.]|nr:N-acetylmuramoyl-L-alanine amidase [Pigmentiphaga sp.]
MNSRFLPRLLAPLALAGLAACATGPGGLEIDRSITATGQNSRVEFIVLHYTNSATPRSLQLLSRGEVSAHYLVTDGDPPRVYQLVDENRRAWHAGVSQWRGRTWLNASSIGIEIVHQPFHPGAAPDDPGRWKPYAPAQIETVIQLVRDVAQRHEVKPENIVGHSDVAPQRKQDPGPAFPWRRLADEGLGRWYDPGVVAAWQDRLANRPLPSVAWYQARLAEVGYDVPRHGLLDPATRAALRAFQMHWRPELAEGDPDAGTAAVLLGVLGADPLRPGEERWAEPAGGKSY